MIVSAENSSGDTSAILYELSKLEQKPYTVYYPQQGSWKILWTDRRRFLAFRRTRIVAVDYT